MFTKKLSVNHRTDRLPAAAVTGPLRGLLYIIVFPFVGIISLVVLAGCFARQWYSAAK
jgi:hypothetical protein